MVEEKPTNEFLMVRRKKLFPRKDPWISSNNSDDDDDDDKDKE